MHTAIAFAKHRRFPVSLNAFHAPRPSKHLIQLLARVNDAVVLPRVAGNILLKQVRGWPINRTDCCYFGGCVQYFAGTRSEVVHFPLSIGW